MVPVSVSNTNKLNYEWFHTKLSHSVGLVMRDMRGFHFNPECMSRQSVYESFIILVVVDVVHLTD